MPVIQSDIKVYLTGANSDGGSQPNPALSLGKYRSSSAVAETKTLAGWHAADVKTLNVSGAFTNASGYVRIENEIIYYLLRVGNQLKGCQRGALNTTPAWHGDGVVVEA